MRRDPSLRRILSGVLAPATLALLLAAGPASAAAPSVEATPVAARATAPDSAPQADTIAGPSDRVPIRRTGAATDEAQVGAPPAAASSFDLPRLLAAMSIVIGLIFLLKWLAGRAMPGSRPGATGPVRLLGRTVIGPRQQVLTLGIGRRVVVALESHGQSTTLTEITDADEVAELIGRFEGRSVLESDDEAVDAPGAGRFRGFFRTSRREFEAPDESFPAGRDEPAQVPAEMTRDVRELLARVRGLGQSVASSRSGSDRTV